MIWLFLKNKTDLFTARRKMLHFDPEPCLSRRLRRLRNLDYTTADVAWGETPRMGEIDITEIHKPDNTYDCVLGLHVLHQVPDDRRGMCEICRVLKPGGWAILNSRMDLRLQKTNEAFVAGSPQQRRRQFGGEDQLRIYGRDFSERLVEAGFEVDGVSYLEELGEEAVEKYFLKTNPLIYIARKPL